MRWVVTWLRSKPAESIAFAVTCAVALFMACAGALFTAPPGSNLTLLPQPNTIVVPTNGGRADITAIVIEPAGTFVANGTEVLFFTSIGSIERMVRTRDGIARTAFVSDSRSGVAQITAISGGSAPQPAASGSPGTGSGGAATGNGSATTTIVVGNAAVTTVLLTAAPSQLADSRSALITANVVDANSNPIANVPVFFKTTGAFESMDSGGQPVFTDNNGQARDVLRTRRVRGERLRETVTVTASAAGPGVFKEGKVDVSVE